MKSMCEPLHIKAIAFVPKEISIEKKIKLLEKFCKKHNLILTPSISSDEIPVIDVMLYNDNKYLSDWCEITNQIGHPTKDINIKKP